MPMLPSSSSALRHFPPAGSSSKMSPTIARPPPPTASSTATGERSTPSANTPRAASARRWRPGPQPTSSTGPLMPSSSASSVASAEPSQRSSGSGTMVPSISRTCGRRPESAPRRSPSPYMRRAPCTQIAANARANRVCGAWRASARASSIVSMSRNRGCSWTRKPRSSSRACCAAHVDSRLIGTPANAPGRSTESHAPVTPVKRRAEHGVHAGSGQRAHPLKQQRPGQLGRVHADEQGGRRDVIKGRRQTLAQSRPPLRDELKAIATPTPAVALEDQHPPRRRGPGDHVECVQQAGLRQRGGLVNRARRAQPRLRAARQRFLGDHEQCDGLHPWNLIHFSLQKKKVRVLPSLP